MNFGNKMIEHFLSIYTIHNKSCRVFSIYYIIAFQKVPSIGSPLCVLKMNGSRARPRSNYGFGAINLTDLCYNERRYTQTKINTLKIGDSHYRNVSIEHFEKHEPHLLGNGGNSSVLCYKHVASGYYKLEALHFNLFCCNFFDGLFSIFSFYISQNIPLFWVNSVVYSVH